MSEAVAGYGHYDLGGLVIEHETITAVGIDVSIGKSTIAVRRPGGEIVLKAFNVNHTTAELNALIETLKRLEVYKAQNMDVSVCMWVDALDVYFMTGPVDQDTDLCCRIDHVEKDLL